MRVHIACYDDGHIVPRMMRQLADLNGWSIGPFIDPGADVVYYGPYTMYGRWAQPAGMKSTGWFTHYESRTPGKVNQWRQAARAIDLPLLTAPAYRWMIDGSMAYITPGVDTDFFTITRKRRKKRVGIAHIPSYRKGPELAALFTNDDGHMVLYGSTPPKEMPAFYNLIDTYVCTSLEEGVPMPVLEALACGCKLVMPTGVGIEPLLPDHPGIFRYTPGDAAHLQDVVAVALAAPQGTIRNTLRDIVVEMFTIQHWADSNRLAVEDYFG